MTFITLCFKSYSGARGRTRTGTGRKPRGILSPLRLPNSATRACWLRKNDILRGYYRY